MTTTTTKISWVQAQPNPFITYLAEAPLEELLRAEHSLDAHTMRRRSQRFLSDYWMAKTRRLLNYELNHRYIPSQPRPTC